MVRSKPWANREQTVSNREHHPKRHTFTYSGREKTVSKPWANREQTVSNTGAITNIILGTFLCQANKTKTCNATDESTSHQNLPSFHEIPRTSGRVSLITNINGYISCGTNLKHMYVTRIYHHSLKFGEHGATCAGEKNVKLALFNVNSMEKILSWLETMSHAPSLSQVGILWWLCAIGHLAFEWKI